MGRPRKPSPLRDLEGNRSRTDIPDEVELHGVPECPEYLDATAAEHFNFMAAEWGGCGVLKRVDGPALTILADLWSKLLRASEAYDREPSDDALKHFRGLRADWEKQASKLGIQRIDRSRIVTAKTSKADPIRSKFMKVIG